MNRRLITALAIVGILGTGGAAMAVNANVLSAASVDPGILGSATTVLDDVKPTPPNTAPSTGAGPGDDDGVSPDDDGSSPPDPGDNGDSGGDDSDGDEDSDHSGDSEDSEGSDDDSDEREDDD